MKLTTYPTRLEEITVSILCVFIAIVTIGLDIFIQTVTMNDFYLPTIFTWFGLGFLFIGYAFGKKPKKTYILSETKK